MVTASRKLGTNVKQDNRLLNINNKGGGIELAQRGPKGNKHFVKQAKLNHFYYFQK